MVSAIEKRFMKIEANQRKKDAEIKRLRLQIKKIQEQHIVEIKKLQKRHIADERKIKAYQIKKSMPKPSPRVKPTSTKDLTSFKSKKMYDRSDKKYHNFLTITNSKGKVIEKTRYNKRTYSIFRQRYNENKSFDENVHREKIKGTNIYEVRFKERQADGTKSKSKVKPKKGQAYRYLYTLTDKNGNPIYDRQGHKVISSGKMGNAKNKNADDKYSKQYGLRKGQKISERHARKSGEFNFYTYVSKLYSKSGYDEDEGQQIANNSYTGKNAHKNKDFSYEREIVWYD